DPARDEKEVQGDVAAGHGGRARVGTDLHYHLRVGGDRGAGAPVESGDAEGPGARGDPAESVVVGGDGEAHRAVAVALAGRTVGVGAGPLVVEVPEGVGVTPLSVGEGEVLPRSWSSCCWKSPQPAPSREAATRRAMRADQA